MAIAGLMFAQVHGGGSWRDSDGVSVGVFYVLVLVLVLVLAC
jgi:hypothetical protein